MAQNGLILSEICVNQCLQHGGRLSASLTLFLCVQKMEAYCFVS